jgi:ParB family chromosome partitioning protein
VAQTEVARLVGRSRSAVANLLRLLRLPDEVRALVHDGRLSEGHARALLGLDDARDMVRMAERAVAEQWSVRQTEAAVRGDPAPAPTAPSGKPAAGAARGAGGRAPADVRRVEDALRRRLGTDVKVASRPGGRGTLTISFYSNDDLARLLELMLGEPFGG